MGRNSKDPQRIRRPPNSFFQFRCAKIKELSRLKKEPQPNLSKKISYMWREASPEERAIYIAKALEAKEQHKKMYPDYQYRPQKKGKNMTVTKNKTAAAKAKVPGSPSSSTSYSSLTSSSASSPAPTTPDTTAVPMLAGGSSSSGGAFGSNFGQDFIFNYNQPVASGILAIEQPHSVQYDGHLRPSQIVGWTDQPQLPSTSTSGMHWETPSLPPKSAGTTRSLFAYPYYQPQAAHALPQAFNFSPTMEEGLQLPTGGMNQAPQPAPKQAFNQVLPLPQAHAAAPQPETEPSFSEAHSAELEAWNKEFAPLDAGFCDLLAAWTNLREVSASSAASDSPAPSLASGATSPSTSLPPTAAHDMNIADDHTQGLPSQTQDPLALSFDPASFDPSLMLMFYDPLQPLPSSAVWPKALNPFDI